MSISLSYDSYTEIQRFTKRLVRLVWFGEFCSCCCLPLLTQLACSILATTYKPFSESLYGPKASNIGVQVTGIHVHIAASPFIFQTDNKILCMVAVVSAWVFICGGRRREKWGILSRKLGQQIMPHKCTLQSHTRRPLVSWMRGLNSSSRIF